MSRIIFFAPALPTQPTSPRRIVASANPASLCDGAPNTRGATA
jgi:hypothetical protein